MDTKDINIVAAYEKEFTEAVEKGEKSHEFKDHYGLSYIAGKVKKAGLHYVNTRLSYYFHQYKKEHHKNGYITFGIAFRPLTIFDIDSFFTTDIERLERKTSDIHEPLDKIVINFIDMSDEHFKAEAEKCFKESIERQDEFYRMAKRI